MRAFSWADSNCLWG